MLLIKNGRVVDPVTGVDEVMDVLIDGAHIEEVGGYSDRCCGSGQRWFYDCCLYGQYKADGR